MGFIEDLSDQLTNISSKVRALTAPAEIVANYPAAHPRAGLEAGRFLWSEERGSYQFHAASYESHREEHEAENVIEHTFADVVSLAAYVVEHLENEPLVAFVKPNRFCVADLGVLDDQGPEKGTLGCRIERHPAFERWASVLLKNPNGVVDLDHETFADLLLDNREDLLEPEVANMVAKFRSARKIEYDAELDNAQSVAVRVSWTGGTDPATSKAGVPREFEAAFPAYIGAWTPGEEPKHGARFRVRIVPPKNSASAAPLFRITWVNALDYEAAAARALQEAITGHLTPAKVPVYLGKPNAKHYVGTRYTG